MWEPEKKRKGLTPSQRAKIILRVNGICSYCKKRFDADVLEVHHIKPLSKGGSNRLTNIVVLCPTCHRRVHTGKISTNQLEPIVKRRKPTVQKKVRGTIRCSDCERLYREFGVGPYLCDAYGMLNVREIDKPRTWRKCGKFNPKPRAKNKYRRIGRGWKYLG